MAVYSRIQFDENTRIPIVLSIMAADMYSTLTKFKVMISKYDEYPGIGWEHSFSEKQNSFYKTKGKTYEMLQVFSIFNEKTRHKMLYNEPLGQSKYLYITIISVKGGNLNIKYDANMRKDRNYFELQMQR